MQATNAQLARAFDRTADHHRQQAVGKIAQLKGKLEELDRALRTDVSPRTATSGDLGLVEHALQLQRHVDAWLTARSAATTCELSFADGQRPAST